MALPPILDYDAYIMSPGVDLALTGVGTPNLTATYGDYGAEPGASPAVKANCTVSISYANIAYTINPDNSVTVTGNITNDTLRRVATGVYSSHWQEILVDFNNQRTFYDVVKTASSGTYDLNLPASFSVTIQPSDNPQPQLITAIHYRNHNTVSTLPPDEFYLGLSITNPNPPEYRPGATLDSDNLWQSHNRGNGKAHIRNSNGKWIEMRTANGHSENGNPPSIRLNDKWANQLKLGKE